MYKFQKSSNLLELSKKISIIKIFPTQHRFKTLNMYFFFAAPNDMLNYNIKNSNITILNVSDENFSVSVARRGVHPFPSHNIRCSRVSKLFFYY